MNTFQKMMRAGNRPGWVGTLIGALAAPSLLAEPCDKEDPSLPGVGKRQGGKPWGRIIEDSIRSEFADGEIVLSATGYLNFAGGKRSSRQSFRFEEMKLPEVAE